MTIAKKIIKVMIKNNLENKILTRFEIRNLVKKDFPEVFDRSILPNMFCKNIRIFEYVDKNCYKVLPLNILKETEKHIKL